MVRVPNSETVTMYLRGMPASEVLGLGPQTLPGRDVLNRLTVVLQGPGRSLEITA